MANCFRGHLLIVIGVNAGLDAVYESVTKNALHLPDTAPAICNAGVAARRAGAVTAAVTRPSWNISRRNADLPGMPGVGQKFGLVRGWRF